MIIRDKTALLANYEKLAEDDVILGRISLRSDEENILLDLVSRGVTMIPSARSQLLSRSKVFQARILCEYMVPGTRPVYSIHDMMQAVSEYGDQYKGAVVCKLDRANGGRGILLFSSIEDVYTQASLEALAYPFIIQPFVEECVDVRVIMLGDYIEAYRRYNPNNFRHNLHCGGTSSVYSLTEAHLRLCYQVMRRADFFYAHIDLLITKSGKIYLSEINLRGGLRGAQISPSEYKKRITTIHSDLVEKT